jgi:hypothetical protein
VTAVCVCVVIMVPLIQGHFATLGRGNDRVKCF